MSAEDCIILHDACTTTTPHGSYVTAFYYFHSSTVLHWIWCGTL